MSITKIVKSNPYLKMDLENRRLHQIIEPNIYNTSFFLETGPLSEDAFRYAHATVLGTKCMIYSQSILSKSLVCDHMIGSIAAHMIYRSGDDGPKFELEEIDEDGKICPYNTPFKYDDLPEVDDFVLDAAGLLLQSFADDLTQPLSRRFEAALLVYGIAHDQNSLCTNGNLNPLFEYGGNNVIASLLVDAFKARWPNGDCRGTIREREFMPDVYLQAQRNFD